MHRKPETRGQRINTILMMGVLVVMFLGLAYFAFSIIFDPSTFTVNGEHYHIVYGKNGQPNRYASWDEKDRVWRYVMLPGTVIGTTTSIYDEGQFREVGKTESQEGRPLTLADLRGQDLEEFKRQRVTRLVEAPDGNYIVSYESSDSGFEEWTVWGPDVAEWAIQHGMNQKE